MKYTVVWQKTAEAELTQIWLVAPDRPAIQLAADHLDRVLAANPIDVGESRIGEYRIAFFPPLGFEFRIVEDERRVVVVRIWRISIHVE